MRAVWLEGRGFEVRGDVARPELAAGEALVKVHLAGVCSTDLEMLQGYYPFNGVMGHEFVGSVVEAAGETEWIGRRVAGEITVYCSKCAACREGLTGHCEQRSVIGLIGRNGCFADFLALPTRNLHAVPDGVPDEAAVFTEPLAAALEIQQQVHIRPEMRVLLVGAGRLGLLIAQTLALTGCDLQVLVRSPRARQLLAERKIRTVSAAEINPHTYAVVVEASGSPEGFSIARQAVRPTGVMVLKSTFAGGSGAHLSSLVVDEVRLVGSRCGPFEPALRLLERGLVDTHSLIDGILPLERAGEAFEMAVRPGVLKILLRM
jgi:threonine dehydrogenase-like Zn-dependent dehydrogenase